MIVLDTNVLSELMRPYPASTVQRWLVRVGLKEDFSTTAVTQAEILMGIAILPEGKRRRSLQVEASRVLSQFFQGRILAFESMAAGYYADIMAMRRGVGHQIEPLDAMIAAIARAHGVAIATRNITHFEGCGVTLHDPWSELEG